MENNSALPVLVEGTEDIQIYERDGELCMSAEDIGKCLEYSDPSKGMDKLYQNNKEELEEYRFSLQMGEKTAGDFSPQNGGKSRMGRPPIFYYEEGIYTAAFLAKTEAARNFRRKVARLLKQLRQRQRSDWNQKYVMLLEKHVELMEKKRKPNIPLTPEEKAEIKNLHVAGCGIGEIARRTGRSKPSVSNLVKYGTTSGRRPLSEME